RLLRQLGREDEALQWIDAAERLHQQRIARFPEASYGHALGHYLEYGDDPQQVLQVAQQACQARQDSATTVGLAEALAAAGQPEVALVLLDEGAAAGLDTPAMHLLAMKLCREQGNEAQADMHRDA